MQAEDEQSFSQTTCLFIDKSLQSLGMRYQDKFDVLKFPGFPQQGRV